jgi:hypothetical protein
MKRIFYISVNNFVNNKKKHSRQIRGKQKEIRKQICNIQDKYEKTYIWKWSFQLCSWKKIITYLVFLLFTNLPWILAFFCYSRNCSPWHKKIRNWNDHFQLWNFKLWIHFSYEFFNSSWTILYGLFPDFSYYFFLGFFFCCSQICLE